MRLRGPRHAVGVPFGRAAQHRDGDGRGRHRDEHEDGQIRGHVRAMLAPAPAARTRLSASAVSGVS